jgi:hypothetical protein
MAVTLTALGARVQVAGPDGGRWAEMPGCCALSNPVRT